MSNKRAKMTWELTQVLAQKIKSLARDLSDSINEIRDFFDGLFFREFTLENYVALRLSLDGVQLTNMSNHYATAGTFQD